MKKDLSDMLDTIKAELEEEGIVLLEDDFDQAEEWLSLVSVAGCYSSGCCSRSQRMG